MGRLFSSGIALGFGVPENWYYERLMCLILFDFVRILLYMLKSSIDT